MINRLVLPAKHHDLSPDLLPDDQVPLHDPHVPEVLQPDNQVDLQPPPQLRRSTRTVRPPSYLQDYVQSVTYPIQNHLSYDQLSPQYKDYICQVTASDEPAYY